MSPDSIAQLIYLGAFALVLGGGFLLTSRLKLGQTLQMAAIWGLIFVGAIGAVGLWGDIRDDLYPTQTRFEDSGQIVIPRSRDGHYYITLDLNGAPIQFVVDTGATDMVLTQTDAAAAGLDPGALNYFGRAFTANGEVRTAPVRLDSIEVGPVRHENVRAVVNQGEMQGSLLGMSYLQQFSSIEITGGTLVLSR